MLLGPGIILQSLPAQALPPAHRIYCPSSHNTITLQLTHRHTVTNTMFWGTHTNWTTNYPHLRSSSWDDPSLSALPVYGTHSPVISCNSLHTVVACSLSRPKSTATCVHITGHGLRIRSDNVNWFPPTVDALCGFAFAIMAWCPPVSLLSQSIFCFFLFFFFFFFSFFQVPISLFLHVLASFISFHGGLSFS